MFDGAEFRPSDETENETVQGLRYARDLIAKPGGWIQRQERFGEAYCSLGAVREAAFHMHGPKSSLAGTAFRELVQHHLNVALGMPTDTRGKGAIADWVDVPRTIANWNDYSGRKQHEVVALFDRAIDHAIRESRARTAVAKELVYV